MKEYYIALNGQQEGPLSEQNLRDAAAAGTYPKDALIWCEGMEDWEPLEKHFQVAAEASEDFTDSPTNNQQNPEQKKKKIWNKALIIKLVIAFLILAVLDAMFGSVESEDIMESEEAVFAKNTLNEINCFYSSDWEDLSEAYERKIGLERRNNVYDIDGDRRDKPLYTELEMHVRCLNGMLLHANDPYFSYRHYSDIKSQISKCEVDLCLAHPSEVASIRQRIANLEQAKKNWEVQFDYLSTLCFATVFAEGVLNDKLSKALYIVYDLKEEHPDNSEINDLASSLNSRFISLSKFQKELPTITPLEAHLVILDNHEKKLKEFQNYQSPPEFIQIRKNLRKIIKSKIQSK